VRDSAMKKIVILVLPGKRDYSSLLSSGKPFPPQSRYRKEEIKTVKSVGDPFVLRTLEK